MLVSVVIPTCRREAALCDCLRCLRHQRFDHEQFEIVVADDGPSENARRLTDNFRQSSDIVVRYVPVRATQGPAAARNAGWRAAVGEIIAFTDDDCLPDRDWLAAGVAMLQRKKADAAVGRTLVPLPERPTDGQRDLAGLADAEFITANCFCRREALERIGGFDERFTLAWREDSDLHFTLLERGMTVVRAGGATVVHPAKPMPWGASLRQQRKGLFDPLLYRKHPMLYRRHIRSLPRMYYAAVASLAVAAVGIIASRPLVFIMGMTLWLSLTAFFAARRLRNASHALRHVAEMVITSALIPPLSIYWRLRGAWRYRVFYL